MNDPNLISLIEQQQYLLWKIKNTSINIERNLANIEINKFELLEYYYWRSDIDFDFLRFTEKILLDKSLEEYKDLPNVHSYLSLTSARIEKVNFLRSQLSTYQNEATEIISKLLDISESRE